MQFSKGLLVIGATLVCITPLAGRAADKAPMAPRVAPTPAAPDAVEKAREAMRQKMYELQGQPPAATPPGSTSPAPAPANPVVVPQTPAPAPEPTPVPAPEPPVAAAPPQAQAVEPPAQLTGALPPPSRPSAGEADPQAIEKARAAVREKMSELSPQPPQGQQPQAQAAAEGASPKPMQPTASNEQPKPAKVAKPPKKSKAPRMVITPAPPKPVVAKPEVAKPEVTKPVAAKPVVVKPVVVKNSQAFEPLQAPPLPISTGQKERLDELLAKYKADQLTPEQYHQARAKILAEP